MTKEQERNKSEFEVASVSFVYDKNREQDWKTVFLALFEEELAEMLEEGVQEELR